jgi:hypothetical protein
MLTSPAHRKSLIREPATCTDGFLVGLLVGVLVGLEKRRTPPVSSENAPKPRRPKPRCSRSPALLSTATPVAHAARVDLRHRRSTPGNGRIGPLADHVSRRPLDPTGPVGGSAWAEPPYVLRAVTSHQEPHQSGTDPSTKMSIDREEIGSDRAHRFAHKCMQPTRPRPITTIVSIAEHADPRTATQTEAPRLRVVVTIPASPPNLTPGLARALGRIIANAAGAAEIVSIVDSADGNAIAS